MKAKVLVLTPQPLYPYWFYGRSSMFFTLLHLQKYVDVYLTFPFDKREPFDIKPLEDCNIKVFPFPHNKKDSIWLVLGNLLKKEPFKVQKYFSEEYLNFIIDIMEKVKPNIVQIHTPHMATYGLYIKDKYDVPIVLRLQDIVTDQILTYLQYTGNPLGKFVALWQWKKTYHYEIKVWRSFSRSIFITYRDYKRALEYLEKEFDHDVISGELDRYCFIYDGVELKDNLYLQFRNQRENIISFAASDQIQNIESIKWWINNVWKYIYKELKLSLHIFGKVCDSLKKVYTEDALKRMRITLRGYLPNKRLLDIELAKSKVFISPTYIGSGYRTKIFDVGAIGIPVICSEFDYESLPPDFEKNKHILVASTPEEWLTTLEIVEKEKLLLESFSNNIHEILRKYSWDKTAENFYRIYSELMKKV